MHNYFIEKQFMHVWFKAKEISLLLITEYHDHAQKTLGEAFHQAFSYMYIVWFQQQSQKIQDILEVAKQMQVLLISFLWIKTIIEIYFKITKVKQCTW